MFFGFYVVEYVIKFNNVDCLSIDIGSSCRFGLDEIWFEFWIVKVWLYSFEVVIGDVFFVIVYKLI